MGRYHSEFILQGSADQAMQEINTYLYNEGYEYTNYKGEMVYKKGHGIMSGPTFAKIEVFGKCVVVEAWIKFAAMPGVYCGEMGLDGITGAIPKSMLKTRIEMVENILRSFGAVPSYAEPVNTSQMGYEQPNEYQAMSMQSQVEQPHYEQPMPTESSVAQNIYEESAPIHTNEAAWVEPIREHDVAAASSAPALEQNEPSQQPNFESNQQSDFNQPNFAPMPPQSGFNQPNFAPMPPQQGFNQPNFAPIPPQPGFNQPNSIQNNGNNSSESQNNGYCLSSEDIK